MEAATAATSSNANLAEEPDDDVRTLAEPEMEVDIDDAGYENQPDEEQQDPDANENQEEVAERRLYFSKRTSISSTLQVPYYPKIQDAYCIDPICFLRIHVLHRFAMYVHVVGEYHAMG